MKKVYLAAALPVVAILALVGCAQQAPSNLVVSADIVRGHEAPQGVVCVLNSQYHYGEMAVFRARVIDPETGNQLPADPGDLLANPPAEEELAAMDEGLTVTVHFSDGQSFPMHFGGHSGDNPVDYFWTASWVVPEGYPTGTIDYWITAADGTNTGRFDPFQVAPSKLTILE